jgi:hypothetical protein
MTRVHTHTHTHNNIYSTSCVSEIVIMSRDNPFDMQIKLLMIGDSGAFALSPALLCSLQNDFPFRMSLCCIVAQRKLFFHTDAVPMWVHSPSCVQVLARLVYC